MTPTPKVLFGDVDNADCAAIRSAGSQPSVQLNETVDEIDARVRDLLAKSAATARGRTGVSR